MFLYCVGVLNITGVILKFLNYFIYFTSILKLLEWLYFLLKCAPSFQKHNTDTSANHWMSSNIFGTSIRSDMYSRVEYYVVNVSNLLRRKTHKFSVNLLQYMCSWQSVFYYLDFYILTCQHLFIILCCLYQLFFCSAQPLQSKLISFTCHFSTNSHNKTIIKYQNVFVKKV